MGIDLTNDEKGSFYDAVASASWSSVSYDELIRLITIWDQRLMLEKYVE